jgi:hypothetical protein
MKTNLRILAAVILLVSIVGISTASPLCHIRSDAKVAGFINQEDLEKFKQFIYDEDFDTGDEFLMQKMIIGKATVFEKGESVYVEDLGWFGIGDVQVRRPGEIESYWTLRNAVECPQ